MVSGLFESLKSCSVPTQMPRPSCHTTQACSGFAASSVGCLLVAAAVSRVAFFAGLLVDFAARLLVVAATSIGLAFAGLLAGFTSDRLIGFLPVRFVDFTAGFLAAFLDVRFFAIVPTP